MFDPRVPGGVIGEGSSIANVEEFQLDASESGEISLSWKIPTEYDFLDYSVHVFKVQCSISSNSCTLPEPGGSYGSASFYQIHEGKNESFTDTDLVSGFDYTYWVYMNLGEQWSSGVKKGAVPPEGDTSNTISSPDNFWSYNSWTYGQTPDPPPGFDETIMSANIFDAGPTTFPKITGKFAFAKDKTVMYYADTDQNRVIVLAKEMALSCQQYKGTDPESFDACMINSYGEPFTPVNILGQPDQRTTVPCGDPDALPIEECLTAPEAVYVNGDELLIADTGNDRIVVHEDLPITNGCDTEMVLNETTSRDCRPDRVIGKVDLADTTNYSLSTYGNIALNEPADMEVYNNDLFILDRGNHRIVKAQSYQDPTEWDCTPTTFGNATCSYQLALGQPDLFENETFKNMVSNDPTIIDSGSGLGNNVSSSHSNILARYFANPSSFEFTESGDLLVSSYEDFQTTSSIATPIRLYGRILVFDAAIIDGSTPTCNSATFSNGNCDAKYVLGQIDFDTLPVYSTTSGSYKDNIPYGLTFVSDISESGGSLLAVDGATSDVYSWNEYANTSTTGMQPNVTVEDPQGAEDPINPGTSLPDLGSLSAVHHDSDSDVIYISDPENHHVYEVQVYEF